MDDRLIYHKQRIMGIFLNMQDVLQDTCKINVSFPNAFTFNERIPGQLTINP